MKYVLIDINKENSKMRYYRSSAKVWLLVYRRLVSVIPPFTCLRYVFSFETESHCVDLAGLELTL